MTTSEAWLLDTVGARPHTGGMTTTQENPTFAGARLTYGEYQATVAKITKVNERAVQRGFTGRLFVVADRQVVERLDTLTGLTKREVIYWTRVEGEAPAYCGWQFLARIDRVGESFTIATAPGVEHVDRSLVHVGQCDHCGHDRRRNNTYLVRNVESGVTRNVGSTCIKDFLGWDAGVVFFAEGDSSLSVEQGGPNFTPEFTLDTVLGYAWAATKAFGWKSSNAFDGRSTADWVRAGLGLYRLSSKEADDLARLREFAGGVDQAVADVKAFVLSDEFSGTSTYVENLKAVFEQDTVGTKQIGLVASAPQALIRYQENEAERKAREAKWAAEREGHKASEWVGQEKDKVEINATIESIRYLSHDFGTTTLYTLLGEDGNLYKWFASRSALGEETGTKVTLRGTVKKHDDYKGTKSTVLTRCKAV